MEKSVTGVCKSVRKSGATRAECARAAFKTGKLVEEDRETKYRDLQFKDVLVNDNRLADMDKNERKKRLSKAIVRANLFNGRNISAWIIRSVKGFAGQAVPKAYR